MDINFNFMKDSLPSESHEYESNRKVWASNTDAPFILSNHAVSHKANKYTVCRWMLSVEC